MGDIERDSTWARTAYNAYWGEQGITPSETQWAKDANEWPSWMAVVAAILDGPPNASLLAEVERLTEQLREASLTAALEAQTSADLRAVNDVLRAQLAEAARAGAEWVTDGNTLRLVVRRVTEASVGAVVSSDRGADWTVRVSGGPSAQGFQPGGASTEQAKRIVETVSGVKP